MTIQEKTMTLGDKLALFAASAAMMGLGTLAATTPASAAPLIAAQSATPGHYGLDISLSFGGGGYDHHYDRDWHHRDWDRDHDRGYGDGGWHGDRDWHRSDRGNGDRGWGGDGRRDGGDGGWRGDR
jgi:hypothetical protein